MSQEKNFITTVKHCDVNIMAWAFNATLGPRQMLPLSQLYIHYIKVFGETMKPCVQKLFKSLSQTENSPRNSLKKEIIS